MRRVRDLTAIAGLLLLTAVAYGGHVRRGFFAADDWFYYAVARFGGHTMGLSGGSGSGWTETVGALFDVFPDRPTLPFVFATMDELFGFHMKLHVAAAVGAGFVMAAAFYVLLRTLAIERVHSFAIAALAILFPYADAPRLWATGIQASLAMIAFLLGLTVALHGLRVTGRRGAAVHAGAVALYVLSVLTYQLTLGLILASGLVYLLRGARRAALVRWAADVIVVLPVAAIAGATSPKSTSDFDLDRLHKVYDTAWKLLPQAAWPKQSALGSTALALALLIVPALAALLVWRGRASAEVRRWAAIAGVSAVMAAAGYLALFPAESYNALDIGIGNRVNLAASLGMVALVYADLMLIALLVLRGPLRHVRTVAVLVCAVLLGLGYRDVLDRHDRDYRQAYNLERIVIGAMLESHAPPPRGATLYVVGHPFSIGGVPVFSSTFATRSAAKVYLDPSFQAAPLGGLAKLVCRRDGVYPAESPGTPVPYGKALVVEVPAARITRITSRAVCLQGRFPLTPVSG